jgi:N-acetylmuramoyl-L-alanine amidase
LTTLERSQRALPLGAALLLMLLPALPASARVSHNDAWARDKFAQAERMREALNGRPAKERTRRQYQQTIDAYRRVYFGAPGSSKADSSVVAVAELQVEMGRQFDDNKTLQSAVAQYEFLRKEYPGSKYRFDALFTMGEIYKDDLDDPEEAKTTFEQFLHRYPHNRLVPKARDAIAEINEQSQALARATKAPLDRDSARRDAAMHEAEKYQRAADGQARAGKNEKADAAEAKEAVDSDADEEAETRAPASTDSTHGKYARVTMVRTWSTPDYTRVAIDLEQDVKFGAQRISKPDRIFFDLYDTKLASTLVGKTFDVDDGFLKKIRVAQYKPGLTRVVLEVDDFSEYNAFLLPNPSRLIIDVHGKPGARRPQSEVAAAATPKSAAKDAATKEIPEEETAPAAGEEKVVVEVPPAKHPSKQPKVDVAKVDASKAPLAAGDAAVIEPVAKNKSDIADSPTKRTVPKKIVEADDDDPPKKSGTKKTTDDVDDVTVTTVSKSKPESAISASPNESTDAAESAASKPVTTTSKKGKRRTPPADIETREAQPTAAGDRSLIRALGLKIGKIVIDPGHGGHDTGTIGPNGLLEKDLVVDVGRRLGKLLETRMGAEVVYTRKDDTFIPLETRTAIANREQADLFVSIHANSSRDATARGVETYYLNFTSNPEAMEVAARENAVSEKSIHELSDLVKKITLKDKIDESREFAGDVQEALHSGIAAKGSGIKDRGVKKAPFIVLIGANMPSILAEISFVSNPTDEKKLETPEYRQRIAESLYRGIQKYVSGLSGVKVASKLAKNEGQ